MTTKSISKDKKPTSPKPLVKETFQPVTVKAVIPKVKKPVAAVKVVPVAKALPVSPIVKASNTKDAKKVSGGSITTNKAPAKAPAKAKVKDPLDRTPSSSIKRIMSEGAKAMLAIKVSEQD